MVGLALQVEVSEREGGILTSRTKQERSPAPEGLNGGAMKLLRNSLKKY